MFKIVDKPTFTRTVTVRIPNGDDFAEATMIATFRAIPVSEAQKFSIAHYSGQRGFLEHVIVRLDDVRRPRKATARLERGVRDAVLDLPYARQALLEAYGVAVLGARQGN